MVKVALLCKTTLEESNTSYAQGGIAAVTYEPDSFEKTHTGYTLLLGDGHCNLAAVEKVIREAPDQIKELLSWGVDFDRTDDGKFDLHREGGHSEHRILHHKDNTGFEIQQSMVRKVKLIPMLRYLRIISPSKFLHSIIWAK